MYFYSDSSKCSDGSPPELTPRSKKTPRKKDTEPSFREVDKPAAPHQQVKVIREEGQSGEQGSPGSGLGGTSDDESMLQQLRKLNVRSVANRVV